MPDFGEAFDTKLEAKGPSPTEERYTLREAQRELSRRDCGLFSGHAPVRVNRTLGDGAVGAWCECGDVEWIRASGIRALLDYCDKISSSPGAIVKVTTVKAALETGAMPPLEPRPNDKPAKRGAAPSAGALAALKRGESRRGRQGRLPGSVSFRRAQ